MLVKHFDKIYTFLVVYRENGFSKASKILNISQPAITQQIKILEDYLGVELFERKKNGVNLTKEGERFLDYAIELEDFVKRFEKKLNVFLNSKHPFVIGASPTIGNYNMPECVKYFKTLIDKEIDLIIKSNDALVEDLKNNKLDIAFLTKPIKDNEIETIKWNEDELVVFSNKPLPINMKLEDLTKYKIICREKNSSTREFIRKIFEKENFKCEDLNIVSVVHNSTALKYTVMNSNEQVISIISKIVIKKEIEEKKLFTSKIDELKLTRDTFIAYKERNRLIDSIINFLIN